jgi:hypothetical protein
MRRCRSSPRRRRSSASWGTTSARRAPAATWGWCSTPRGGGPFGHTAQPWKAWASLADVEQADGDDQAAATALARARAAYLEYRRDGGAPEDGASRLIAQVGAVCQQQGPEAAQRAIPPAEAFDEGARPLRDALIGWINGIRDPRALGTDRFPYPLAAEFELLGAR